MEHFKLDMDNLQVPEASPKPLPKRDRAWVLARVELLMSSYRKTDYHNPEGFITTLVAILEQYDPAIVEYVTDPLTGIQRRAKWPPTPAEIVEACAAEISFRTKLAQNSSWKAVPRLPRPKFSIADSFEEMTKKHGRPHGVFEDGRALPYDG